MKNIFDGILKGKTVILGVGNVLRGDDAFGIALAENLLEEKNIVSIAAGPSPENYAGKIIKENPATVIIADAAHFGGKPGEYRLAKHHNIEETGMSTHNISLKMLIEYLSSSVNADIYILVAQPRDISLGASLSREIKTTIKTITGKIRSSSLTQGN